MLQTTPYHTHHSHHHHCPSHQPCHSFPRTVCCRRCQHKCCHNLLHHSTSTLCSRTIAPKWEWHHPIPTFDGCPTHHCQHLIWPRLKTATHFFNFCLTAIPHWTSCQVLPAQNLTPIFITSMISSLTISPSVEMYTNFHTTSFQRGWVSLPMKTNAYWQDYTEMQSHKGHLGCQAVLWKNYQCLLCILTTKMSNNSWSHALSTSFWKFHKFFQDDYNEQIYYPELIIWNNPYPSLIHTPVHLQNFFSLQCNQIHLDSLTTGFFDRLFIFYSTD